MAAEPDWFLRVRRYPEGKFVSAWVVRRTAGACAGLMFGEVTPAALDALVKALGLPVEEETSPVEGLAPLRPVGCLGVPGQLELFNSCGGSDRAADEESCMIFPESVRKAVLEAVRRSPQDTGRAIDFAEQAIRGLPEFGDLLSKLVRSAVEDLVYDVRHSLNRATRRGGEAPPGAASRATLGGTTAAREVYRSAYDYHIAGTSLGSILGKDLLGLAKREHEMAGGHLFNARLCEALRPLVADMETVKSAVPNEKKLKAIFARLQKAGDGNAGAA